MSIFCIGPSGSGKSTLLSLIAGFLPDSAGEVRVDVEPIHSLAVAEYPVSIVFQQHNLFPHLDLYTNVALGVDPSLRVAPTQIETVREQDRAALLISHQPGDALIASARPAFICEGRVAALASTRQLLAQSEPPQLREYLGSK